MTLFAAILAAGVFSRPLERVSTMDPAMARSIYDARAIALVYETPLTVDYTARPYRLRAGCCELPTVGDNGRTYRFAMRHGSAADVVRALERLRDPNEVTPNGWIVKDVDTVRAVDSKTLEIRLKRKVDYFPWLMSMTAAAPRLSDGSGTGPYALKSWRKNHEMTFVRKTPIADGFDVVRYLVVDDLTTQWLMFLRGELDFIGEVSRDNWDSILGQDGKLDAALEARGVRLYAIPTLDAMHFGFNMSDPVVGGNRKLRQALNAAFDYPAWERFYNHRICPLDGPIPAGVEGRLDTPFKYGFNLELARRLMTEAGYEDGIDPKTGRRLVLTLAIGRATQESREAGELAAAFYAKIGIRLELEFMTWDAFLRAVNERRVQMYRMGWVGDYPHVQNFLQLFYSPNASPGVNHSNYANPEYDAAYENDDWRRCQEIIREDCPWVFTHVNVASSLTGPKVSNYVPSVFSYGNEQYYKVRGKTR